MMECEDRGREQGGEDMKEMWRLVRRRADQDVPLVGVVFSIFLLQNQKQLLKQEHVSLSSFLPHLTHSL